MRPEKDKNDLRWTLLTADRLPSVRSEWQALAQRLGSPLALDHDLINCLLSTFAPSHIALARYGTPDVAYAFGLLQHQSRFSWRTARLDNAPLGPWLIDPAYWNDAVLRKLLLALPGRPLQLSLLGLDPQLASRPASWPRTRTLDHFVTPALTITPPFDTWYATLSKNFRHNLKRQPRRLEEAGIAMEVRCLTAPDDMAQAVADYARLEAAGWKAEAGTAVAPGSLQEKFYARLLRSFAQRGEAQVWQIRYDKAVAASDLCLHRDGVTLILKTAYSEALAGNHSSPAQLLRRQMFETLFQGPGARSIEFYGPLKPWHLSWTREQRHLYHVNHYRWRWLARLRELLGRRARTKDGKPDDAVPSED